jgi:hypothetical protein
MCFKIYYNFEVCCGGHKKGGSRYSEVFHDYVVNMAKVSLVPQVKVGFPLQLAVATLKYYCMYCTTDT